MIFGGGANPGFRVNSAGEMIVQISAFGHLEEKLAKGERIGARDFEAAGGALFQADLDDSGRRRFRLREGRDGKETQKNKNDAEVTDTEPLEIDWPQITHRVFPLRIAAPRTRPPRSNPISGCYALIESSSCAQNSISGRECAPRRGKTSQASTRATVSAAPL